MINGTEWLPGLPGRVVAGADLRRLGRADEQSSHRGEGWGIVGGWSMRKLLLRSWL
jgi:hypothetical protein